MPLTVGGGVRTTEDIRNLLLAGADKASINSAAVADRQFVRAAAEKFGSQCVVVAIDAKRVAPASAALGDLHPWRAQADRHRRGRVRAGGGGTRRRRNPADLDGPRRRRVGFDLELTRAVADAVAIPVIASGGVGKLDHLVEGVVQGHASAVLAASIFHFGEYTIRQAKERMAGAGIAVRLD